MSTTTEERSLEEMFASLDSKLDAILARHAELRVREEKTYTALKDEANMKERIYKESVTPYRHQAWEAFDEASRRAYTYGWIRGLIS